jgi:hypothetical protein
MEPLHGVGVHHEHQHTALALGAVGDLHVGDVHTQVARQGGDLGQHPGLVGYGHPQLRQALGRHGVGGQRAAGRGGPPQHLEQPGPVPGRHPVTHGGQVPEQGVEGGHDGRRVLGAHVGPDGGLAGGHPGHVPEPAGRQAQQGPVLLGHPVGQVHEGGGRQVGHVRHHGHQRVVLLG